MVNCSNKDILVCVNYFRLGVCDTVFLLWSAKVRDEAPCLKRNDMILWCLVKDVALCGVIDEYGAMVDLWLAGKNKKL